MNQKYILYIYDTILTEINSLEIISEQTFIKYLDECSSESKLYFKIEIIKKNGKSKYTIDKPTHTLHPKTPKFLCDIATKNSFYKGIFAKILDDIKLEYGNNNVNWYSEKDSTAFFLSIDFELKFLSKKELYFLYCFQKLLKENQRIKKINKKKVFNFKSKERVEYFIQKQQSNLENLAGKLIREINPPTHYNLYEFSDNYTKEDYLKLTFIYLEKIIVFIENEYSEYLNVNIKVPYRTILMKENLISNKLEYIKSKLLSEKLNDAILRITFEPLIKISTINIQESITYNEFNFCLTYIKELFCILKSNANEVETNKIEEWLYEINFNELSFFKYIVDNIIIDLEKLDSEFEKIDFLYSLLKKLNQIQTKNLISYNNKLPSNRVQIISWIEEEIDYLQKKIKLETKNTIPHQHEDKQKMLSGISVAQISYFFNLLVQTNIIKPKNQREIFKFIAENFKTSITETISSDSVSAKFYNVETGTKNAIREKIIEMLNHTKH